MNISDNGFSYNLYFDYMISSESNFDYLKVYINGTLVYQDLGFKTSYCEKPLNSGNNTIILQYSKDGSVTVGLDAVFIDNLQYKRVLSPTTIQSVNGSLANIVDVTINYPEIAILKEYSFDGVTWYKYTSTLNVQSNSTVYSRYLMQYEE